MDSQSPYRYEPYTAPASDDPYSHPFFAATAPTAPTREANPPARESAPPPRQAGAAPRRRVVRPAAALLAVSLLSAGLASGFTALAVAPSLSGSASIPVPTDPSPGNGNTVAVTPSPAASTTGDPVVDVASRVSPAVVTITAQGVSSGFGPFNMPATGVGSGVLVRADGWILTNAHVVEGAQTLTVTLKDGREFDGTVVESDADRDLAVVKIDGSDLPSAEIGSSKDLEVGQLVIAIGSPLGQFTNSVTSGVLSAIGREIQVPDQQTGRIHTLSNLLQTDAAINPGNSGGPLLDEHGKIIGINTAVAGGANGIGFAIPIDDAADILAAAMGASQS
jgi:S1-C subfamily serine protease